MAGKLGDEGEQGVTETLRPPPAYTITVDDPIYVSDPPLVQARSAWGRLLYWGVVVFVVWKVVK